MGGIAQVAPGGNKPSTPANTETRGKDERVSMCTKNRNHATMTFAAAKNNTPKRDDPSQQLDPTSHTHGRRRHQGPDVEVAVVRDVVRAEA